ncbi:DUF6427 family protein [Aequorivita flava]|uniref:DUF6427 family protein n=1 Tax=Aequorivita flava TaxID=3114371 RepID=A0AB35YQZ0_9FLAO
MLTSFFGKSNPINYLILGVFIIAGYLYAEISANAIAFSISEVFFHLLFMLISGLAMLLLDFIIRKNQLTKNNTYAILFFTCFMLMLPVIFLQHKIIFANAFLLLALRRIMSLRSDRNSSKKILDASLWITLAALFYFWSLLFFIPLWIAIVQKPNSNYKQLLIPFTGFLAVVLLNTAYQLLFNNSIGWLYTWKEEIRFNFSAYNSVSILIPVTIISAFYIWTGFYRVLKIPALPLKEKPNFILLLYVSLTTLFVALGAPDKTGAEVLFVLAPVSIICANYIESSFKDRNRRNDASEFWFKEIMLWMVVILPVIFLFL